MGEDTVILGMFSDASAGITISNSEGHIPNSPLRLSSGPLTSPHDSITAPQPVLGKQQFGRSRLFYPTLALIVILIMTLIGGGAFYFLRANESQTVNQALDIAQKQITWTQAAISSNPTSALKAFSTAQNMLIDVQKNPQLDVAQSQRISQLNVKLVKQVKLAISVYNNNAKISVLPCSNTTTNPIDNTSSKAIPVSIAFAGGLKSTPFLYTLALNNQSQNVELFQINNHYGMVSPLAVSKNTPQFVSIASNGQLLFLMQKQVNGNLPPMYTLHVYHPDTQGTLGAPSSSGIISASFTDNGYVPAFITAWGTNVFVMLTSQSDPGNARILSYVLDTKEQLNTPKETKISISAPIVSIAAFPSQLFLLLSSGDVQSLPLLSGNQSSPPPTPVFVQPQIALPLTTSAKDYRAGDPVPTVTPIDKQGSKGALLIPSTSTANTAILTANLVNASPHLYIGDPVHHRVLDLEPLEGGPATPTPVPTGTNVAGSSVILQLVQQYVSITDLNQVKSLAADPQGTKLTLLSQKTLSMASLVSISTGTQTPGCT
jgi:hypothetical protein